MATVRYGDVVQANDTVDLEERLKRRRASTGDLHPHDSLESVEQTEPQNNNEPNKRSA